MACGHHADPKEVASNVHQRPFRLLGERRRLFRFFREDRSKFRPGRGGEWVEWRRGCDEAEDGRVGKVVLGRELVVGERSSGLSGALAKHTDCSFGIGKLGNGKEGDKRERRGRDGRLGRFSSTFDNVLVGLRLRVFHPILDFENQHLALVNLVRTDKFVGTVEDWAG